MNGALLTDPVVLICVGIIVIGLITLLWAITKFKTASAVAEGAPVDEFGVSALGGSTPASLPEIDFKTPEFPTRASISAGGPVSKDVAERLDAMTQRLSEMQTVLMKQSGPAAGGAAGAAGSGQGFSPETVEKLLKIIGNVIQQVDVLQKNLNLTK